MTIAEASDLPFIVDLAQKHCDAVGFLSRSAMAAYLERRRVTVARENGERCGFFLIGAESSQIRIFQACVDFDAQGLGHGLDLLGGIVRHAAATGAGKISLHCRDGLDSNGFWTACGFQSRGLILGGGARRKIVHAWELRIIDAIRNPALPYARLLLSAINRRPSTRTQPLAERTQACT